ncbi:MAG TPA: tRNA (adenosine(37)-N6)-threonylcarbamoyltransferase complex dimerization subunit type 1 TsaB [Candidatus Dependentiae bacterium]|nr:tRNA (adenosine(37)-N6)-threonylcarbamoyltransferase complex dimerization subunit type 1 TsaB [Candidatus Dependentiae bacterium]
MSLVICIHNTYNSVESALACDNVILASCSLAKEVASAHLIPTIDALLTTNKYTLADVNYIIVNQGPAPFTTLRTVIVTVNGIAFAQKIPLVGVDALEACMQEYQHNSSLKTVVLLNAFNRAVYYGINDPSTGSIQKGYAPIEECLEMVHSMYLDTPIQFIGNGTDLYRSEIKSSFASQAQIPEPLPLTASLEQILYTGNTHVKNGLGITHFIEPLYLKKPIA